MAEHLRAGRAAEHIARRYLERSGLTVIAENYRCRRGELDLVMRHVADLVFVEIRYRRTTDPVTPEETVDRKKRRRIATAAAHFLQRHADYGDNPIRFDVVGVSGPLRNPRITWVRNAFTTEDI